MKQGLTITNIKRIDKSNMLEVLLDFPLQCQQALEITKGLKDLPEGKNFEKIVFAGVGGSAIGADLVKSYLYFKSQLPIAVVREYELPAFVDNRTLVFISSYSGDTEETLSAYQQAKEKGACLIALSSDGKLKEVALREGVSFLEIPKGLPSRYALGFLSIVPLCILARLGLIQDVSDSIRQVVKVLSELKEKNISPDIGVKDNLAKYIALRLFNKFPVIYASSINFAVVARRMRTQLNENSKSLSLTGTFPEIAHNEIMGWQNPKKLLKNFAVLFLKDKAINSRITKRMEITKEILKGQGISLLEVWSSGEDLLSRIFSLIYIGDFISFYLAILYGVDPAPTDRIAYLKKELAGA